VAGIIQNKLKYKVKKEKEKFKTKGGGKETRFILNNARESVTPR
jgi:hypothetical protein